MSRDTAFYSYFGANLTVKWPSSEHTRYLRCIDLTMWISSLVLLQEDREDEFLSVVFIMQHVPKHCLAGWAQVLLWFSLLSRDKIWNCPQPVCWLRVCAKEALSQVWSWICGLPFILFCPATPTMHIIRRKRKKRPHHRPLNPFSLFCWAQLEDATIKLN